MIVMFIVKPLKKPILSEGHIRLFIIFYIISDLQVKIDITKHAVQQQDQALVDKERDCVRRVQAAREEEFEKYAKVENEKLVNINVILVYCKPRYLPGNNISKISCFS